MPTGKWLTEAGRDADAGEVARQGLDDRLGDLCGSVADVLQGDLAEPEQIHQLRVAVRRATAAVDGFEICLKSQKAQKLTRRLKQIRRAAGRTRDWDVFLEELAQCRGQLPIAAAPGLDLLVGNSVARRAIAQRKLRSVCRKAITAISRKVGRIVASRSRSRTGAIAFGTLGDFRLQSLVAGFCAQLGKPLLEAADFHALRLALKPLRYTLEIFSSCYAPALREQIYPRLEELQELLGLIQDGQVAVEHVDDLRAQLQTLTPPGWSTYEEPLGGLAGRFEPVVAERCRAALAWRESHGATLQAELESVLSGLQPSESAPVLRRNR